MEIFHISKSFTLEEKYGLTSQIRRSSRSVCSNIGEAYRKRSYKAHFVSKISDSDMENTETQVWLDFILECGYISVEKYTHLLASSEEMGKMPNHMLQFPEKYGVTE